MQYSSTYQPNYLFLVYNEVDERAIGAPPTGREFIVKYSHIFDVFD